MKFLSVSAMKLLVVAFLFVSDAMLAKTKRPYDPSALRGEPKLLANVRDLFASNTVSAKRSQELINDVSSAAGSLRSFKRLRNDKNSNVARTLKNKFLKNVLWPPNYKAWVRVKNLKTSEEEWQVLSFMLPHETIAALDKAGRREVVMCRAGLDPLSLNHLQSCERKAGQELLALGLWGDGVPVNWDRTESVETFSLNLPGQSGTYKPLRLPITSLSRKQVTENTWTDIMEVVAWSLRHAADGSYPVVRHDRPAGCERPWRTDDAKRAKLAGKELPVRAALVEVRGDWKMFGEIFHFPKWNQVAGICWKCSCTPDQDPVYKPLHSPTASLAGGPPQQEAAKKKEKRKQKLEHQKKRIKKSNKKNRTKKNRTKKNRTKKNRTQKNRTSKKSFL